MSMSFADTRFVALLDQLGDPTPSIDALNDLIERLRVRDMVGEIMSVLEEHDLAGAAINQDGDGGLVLSVAKSAEDDVQNAADLDFREDQPLIDSLNQWDATYTKFFDKVNVERVAPLMDELITREQREHWERLAFGAAVATHLEARNRAHERDQDARDVVPARSARSARSSRPRT